MGVSFNGHAGAIDWIQSRFKKGRPATLYFDEIRTPAYTDCLNRLYERVLASDLAGLYHAGGPRALSLYQIAQIVNRVGGYDPNLLMGCPRIEAGPIPPRAGNVTMNSNALCRSTRRRAARRLAIRLCIRAHASHIGTTSATATRLARTAGPRPLPQPAPPIACGLAARPTTSSGDLSRYERPPASCSKHQCQSCRLRN